MVEMVYMVVYGSGDWNVRALWGSADVMRAFMQGIDYCAQLHRAYNALDQARVGAKK